MAMNWQSHQLVMSNGVAIFHLATSRIVVCYDTRERYYFLPKGRRDEGEEGRVGAEREGWEESGYRNRLLPLPVKHRQPRAYTSIQDRPTNVIEPVLTELLPLPREKMYLVHWYIAETLPPKEEEALNQRMSETGNDAVERPYVIPPPYPSTMSFKERIELDTCDDGKTYEPTKHLNTGVDTDEAFFTSQLMSVEEACRELRTRSEVKVVQLGWEYIQERWKRDGGNI